MDSLLSDNQELLAESNLTATMKFIEDLDLYYRYGRPVLLDETYSWAVKAESVTQRIV